MDERAALQLARLFSPTDQPGFIEKLKGRPSGVVLKALSDMNAAAASEDGEEPPADAPPGAPPLFTVNYDGLSPILEWTPPANADTIKIYQTDNRGLPEEVFIEVPAESGSYADTSVLSEDDTIWYAIKATNAFGDSDFTYLIPRTQASGSYLATPWGETQLSVQWGVYQGGLDSLSQAMEIWLKVLPAGEWYLAAEPAFSAGSVIVNDMAEGTEYSLKMRERSSIGSAVFITPFSFIFHFF